MPSRKRSKRAKLAAQRKKSMKEKEKINQARCKKLREEGKWDELSSCASKHRYATENRAIQVAITCSRERGVSLRVYHCKYCDGWHITKRELRDNHNVSE